MALSVKSVSHSLELNSPGMVGLRDIGFFSSQEINAKAPGFGKVVVLNKPIPKEGAYAEYHTRYTIGRWVHI
jgi:hypothetical protein